MSICDLENWREVFETNILGNMALPQETIPQMKRQGSGAILFINTQAIRRPLADEGAYAASKGAVKVLAAYLAGEVGPRHTGQHTPATLDVGRTRARLCAPGSSAEGRHRRKIVGGIAADFALCRIVSDDEVANAGMMLISNYASAVTGATLDANCGDFLPRSCLLVDTTV